MRLVFQKMIHGSSKYGEYLLLIFRAQEAEKNAYFLLSPGTNADGFRDDFVSLTGRNSSEYKPSPTELGSVCAASDYEGEVDDSNGFLQVTKLVKLA